MIFDSVRTLTGAFIIFFLGVYGGVTLTVLVVYPGFWDEWSWYIVAPLFIIPFTVFKLWGLLLIPIYGVVFYGMVWGQWNRLLCFSILALATSVIIFVSVGMNPFSEFGSGIRFILVEGILGFLVVFSAILGRLKNRLIDPDLTPNPYAADK